ncbi:hypothetical protein ES332_D13G126000v1 [Gossypium tomentosum]|uniref:HAT C-terminal dimerisation domain-containing protein n=1 Tax=Gossypium tomentosum TaxID=34277 RepID=A0A5D2HW06_GOSTO|nr:hypothetical protein ES332_D13G126000v1 [Gossypium tomentosum]
MANEFNGLQNLILNDCRYAYYHWLKVVKVHQFFKDLFGIVNIASASSKRHGELQKSQATKITPLIVNLQRPSETRTYNRLRSFEFIFIFHMMKEVLGVIDNICQALQYRSQDILKAMSLVSTTKDLIQKLRDDGWDKLLKNVISFYETWELDFPNINAQYIVGRSHNKKEDVTMEHHYRVDIFFATIDTQLQELKSLFNEPVVELLTLTTTLDPNESFKLFDIDKICIFLEHCKLDVCKHPELRKISTLSELCKSLVESGKSIMYPLVDRLICLILALPVSTASSKRAFSAMKIVKA